MFKPRTVLLPLGFLLAFASVCSAQVRSDTVEISLFGGYLFGGNFPSGTNALFSGKVDVEDQATYGGRIGWNITSLFEVEAQFSRSDTHFVSPGNSALFGSSGTELGDLTIDYYMGYMTFNFGHSRVVPFVSLGMGAARLDADVCRLRPQPCSNPDADWRYTASIGGGVKTCITPHFGIRFDGHYYGTLLNHDDSSCHDHHCHNGSDWLSNGDVTGGLYFSF